jgi:hypothetical protein
MLTKRKITGSIPDEVVVCVCVFFFFIALPSPSSHTMALKFTQLLTELSTRNIPGEYVANT